MKTIDAFIDFTTFFQSNYLYQQKDQTNYHKIYRNFNFMWGSSKDYVKWFSKSFTPPGSFEKNHTNYTDQNQISGGEGPEMGIT